MRRSKNYKKTRSRKITNGKCEGFVNGHCSFHCPNADLEYRCQVWDLDPSDFGMEYIECNNCQYYDDECTCEDCYMQNQIDYCPKAKGKNVWDFKTEKERKGEENV